MKISKQYFWILGISFVLLLQCIAAQAENNNDRRMVVSGQGWYGYDIEQARPHQKSATYMTYELALGFQTEPEDKNIYDQLFGYPTIYIGTSIANIGDFQIYFMKAFHGCLPGVD